MFTKEQIAKMPEHDQKIVNEFESFEIIHKQHLLDKIRNKGLLSSIPLTFQIFLFAGFAYVVLLVWKDKVSPSYFAFFLVLYVAGYVDQMHKRMDAIVEIIEEKMKL